MNPPLRPEPPSKSSIRETFSYGNYPRICFMSNRYQLLKMNGILGLKKSRWIAKKVEKYSKNDRFHWMFSFNLLISLRFSLISMCELYILNLKIYHITAPCKNISKIRYFSAQFPKRVKPSGLLIGWDTKPTRLSHMMEKGWHLFQTVWEKMKYGCIILRKRLQSF